MAKPFLLSILFVATVFLSVPSAQAGVTGKFLGNGKDAKLAHANAKKGEPYKGKATTVIFLTEKAPGDQPLSKGDVYLGKLGSALVIRVDQDGKLVSSQVRHEGHQRKGFSSSGQIELSEYQLTGGKVSGKLKTPKEYDFFEDKWFIDLSFQAPVK